MKLWQDFQKFAFKGNVVDLSIGVVIGGAFGKIVSALVADVIMPCVSLLLPTGNWREHGIVLRHGNGEPGSADVLLRYGDLFGAVLDFFIVAFVLFILISKIVRAAEGRLRPSADAPAPQVRECPYCFETVPSRATRCRACTSELPAVAVAKA